MKKILITMATIVALIFMVNSTSTADEDSSIDAGIGIQRLDVGGELTGASVRLWSGNRHFYR